MSFPSSREIERKMMLSLKKENTAGGEDGGNSLTFKMGEFSPRFEDFSLTITEIQL